MEMSGAEDKAQFPSRLAIALVEGEQERDGIGSAGERDSKAHAGAEEREVERERGGHKRMIWEGVVSGQ